MRRINYAVRGLLAVFLCVSVRQLCNYDRSRQKRCLGISVGELPGWVNWKMGELPGRQRFGPLDGPGSGGRDESVSIVLYSLLKDLIL